MTDPYKVLGVAPSATDDEIKKAYRDLARKYHPDKYRDSDLADLASEKMKEVNAAYEEIQNMRKNGGGAGGNTSSGGGYNYAGSSSTSGNPQYNEIRRNINAGNIPEAERRLYEFHEGDRGAEWNFLMGCVKASRGWYFDAQNYFQRACVMDPQNMEYRRALNNVQSAARGFRTGGYNTSPQAPSTGCDICSALICADCCCDCMGGDLIACC